jgi:hypothetical protein
MPDILPQAVRHHQQGRLDEAARPYQAIPAVQSGHLEALHPGGTKGMKRSGGRRGPTGPGPDRGRCRGPKAGVLCVARAMQPIWPLAQGRLVGKLGGLGKGERGPEGGGPPLRPRGRLAGRGALVSGSHCACSVYALQPCRPTSGRWPAGGQSAPRALQRPAGSPLRRRSCHKLAPAPLPATSTPSNLMALGPLMGVVPHQKGDRARRRGRREWPGAEGRLSTALLRASVRQPAGDGTDAR